MANFKIFSIGKANTRIDELEAENQTLKANLAEAVASTPEALTQASAEVSRLTAENAQSKSDLATAKQTIGTLTAAKEAADKQVAELTAKVAEIPKLAAAKAADIQASIGAPAAPEVPKTATAPAPATGMAAVKAQARADLIAGGFKFKN